jgi:uncharacterized protein
MRRLSTTFSMLIAVTTFTALEHLYLWLRLVRDVGCAAPVERALGWAFVVAAISTPLAVVSSRLMAPRLSRWWVTPAYTWLGTSVLLTLVLSALDLIRLLVALSSRQAAFLALTAGICLSLWAGIEGRRVRVRRVEVPINGLPLALDGLSLVQLSDVHLGPTVGRRFMERVVDHTNRLQPDVVVITGDLVDAPVEHLAAEVSSLARLVSKHGTFCVTGNHEYHAGPAHWCRHLESLGIRVLRNERVALNHLGHVLQLAGTDDSDPAGRAEGFAEDLELALRGRDVNAPLVLLAHQPKTVHAASKLGVDLQLSGHTHGGQLWPFGWLLKANQPLVSGLRWFGTTAVYVSNGTGHSGPPMRLGSPAEITQVILRRG